MLKPRNQYYIHKNFYQKLILGLFLMTMCVVSTTAQTARAYVKAADDAFQNKDYSAALIHYQTALEGDKNNEDLWYKAGEAARLANSYKMAEEYLGKVTKSTNGKTKYPMASFWLAEMKKNRGEYEEAMLLFDNFLTMKKKGVYDEYEFKAKKEMEACHWAQEIIQKPTLDTVLHLDKAINSPYSDFAAVRYQDALYYSSLRFKEKEKDDNEQLKSKIMTSEAGANAKPMGKEVNLPTLYTAHATFNAAGDRMYFTFCDNPSNADIVCEIFYRENDGVQWSKPKKLPDYINLNGFTATQPCIIYDPVLKTDVLYFASNRPNGKGKMDIWFSIIDKNKEFTEPINLAFANTRGNDITPFFAPASNTLFFSSDGLDGLGGYDIYKITKYGLNNWSKTEHLGSPINSSYNDIYFSLNPDGQTGYLSSNRVGSLFLDKNNETCCYDIYEVHLGKKIEKVAPPKEKPLPAPVSENINVKPTKTPETTDEPAKIITDTSTHSEEDPVRVISDEPATTTPSSTPKDPIIQATEPVKTTPTEPESTTPTDEETTEPTSTKILKLENLLPLSLYFDNDEPDNNTKAPTTSKNYEQTYFTYYNKKIKYKSEYGKPLPPEKRQMAYNKMDIFFEKYLKKNYEKLILFSGMLLDRLKQGERVEIFVKGYTSPLALSDYNFYLGQRRIASIQNHFESFRNAIFKPYFDSGQLIVTQRSFGETEADTTVSDNDKDQRNSIYSINAAKERRVEILEVKSEKFSNE